MKMAIIQYIVRSGTGFVFRFDGPHLEMTTDPLEAYRFSDINKAREVLEQLDRFNFEGEIVEVQTALIASNQGR